MRFFGLHLDPDFFTGLVKLSGQGIDVRVDFKSSRLRAKCETSKARLRHFGMARAKKLALRLTVLAAAGCLEDLRSGPGHFHELTGDRDGTFAADLDGPYRMVFEPVLGPGQESEHVDGYDWSKITQVRILEITDYHG